MAALDTQGRQADARPAAGAAGLELLLINLAFDAALAASSADAPDTEELRQACAAMFGAAPPPRAPTTHE